MPQSDREVVLVPERDQGCAEAQEDKDDIVSNTEKEGLNVGRPHQERECPERNFQSCDFERSGKAEQKQGVDLPSCGSSDRGSAE